MRIGSLLTLSCLLMFSNVSAQSTAPASTASPSDHGDSLLADYFRAETSKLTEQTFAGIKTLDDWTQRRNEYRRQLLEMLCLDPMPPKTDLAATVTGSLEEQGVIVERLHFQSMPGLYVTANFYRPRDQQGPLPAILYVCGHGKEMADGVSLGNKTHYQHHGAWFARNGYVCLTIDTVQLGEIEGIHHGTYREGMWWWNNRGYSSAGVEAYNCIRSLDYLQSRDEVDGDRIGVTGRSGGGAYSWWIAAIDQRIKAAVPVAGITSLKNHVVDGCVEGHCDCMYMVNTYRWDFPMVAALVAPRPLLIANSDKDRIFPLDGVVDVYTKTKQIYSLYDASGKLGLHITEGPHQDTQELRIGAFRWFNRFLKKDDELVEMAAKPLFEKQQLKVFDELPADQRVTTIQESFGETASIGDFTGDTKESSQALRQQISQRCFGGWPDPAEPLDVKVIKSNSGSVNASLIEFTSQTPYRLPIYLFQHAGDNNGPLEIVVLDDAGWDKWSPMLAASFPDQLPAIQPDEKLLAQWQSSSAHKNVAFVAPRGIGPTHWTDNDRERTHIRRRFMLLGQTLAGMQIYDVHRSLQALRDVPQLQWQSLKVSGDQDAAVWALYAALFSDGIDELTLNGLPRRNRDAPDLLNISRIIELPDVVQLASQRIETINAHYDSSEQ
ncbi:acetylxylan esterase [Stieleria sp. TO1_6]|uniref:alpha/beta hydrolase family protein n=1 Tax=Stieleria tagensis TaxID=2956795 RepID=UPI00209AD539|nr:acetylxylan esterase [Stieleria tagensis]MCO8120454.1 acetylxylan esterase [Stieleria tagensis]